MNDFFPGGVRHLSPVMNHPIDGPDGNLCFFGYFPDPYFTVFFNNMLNYTKKQLLNSHRVANLNKIPDFRVRTRNNF